MNAKSEVGFEPRSSRIPDAWSFCYNSGYENLKEQVMHNTWRNIDGIRMYNINQGHPISEKKSVMQILAYNKINM